jgi:zinc D-Ala-D-Ala carboxypeptidase
VKLSEHFDLWEFEKSEYAQRKNVNNEIPLIFMPNIKKVADLMEEVRTLLEDKAIIVNSGYRSSLVNSAVGGALTSEHKQACACDFICPSFGTPYQIAKKISESNIKFGQLIQEGTWVHISIPTPKHSNQILTMKKGKYLNGLIV